MEQVFEGLKKEDYEKILTDSERMIKDADVNNIVSCAIRDMAKNALKNFPTDVSKGKNSK